MTFARSREWRQKQHTRHVERRVEATPFTSENRVQIEHDPNSLTTHAIHRAHSQSVTFSLSHTLFLCRNTHSHNKHTRHVERRVEATGRITARTKRAQKLSVGGVKHLHAVIAVADKQAAVPVGQTARVSELAAT